MKETEPTLDARLDTIVAGLGYEFVGSELLRQGRHSVLRIYIDTDKSEKGVTLDDCALVSRQVSAMLDVEDPIQGQYTLEVSSPGLNRPLFTIAHYQRFIGKQVKVRLRAPIEERRNFVGVIMKVVDENIYLLVDAEEVVLPFQRIEKAHIIADIR